jgi:hypothetical protein
MQHFVSINAAVVDSLLAKIIIAKSCSLQLNADLFHVWIGFIQTEQVFFIAATERKWLSHEFTNLKDHFSYRSWLHLAWAVVMQQYFRCS